MDEAAFDWYFSTMGRRGPVAIAFHRTKYGRELLVDAAWVSNLPGFERTRTPHVLDFYDILLITRATGSLAIDGLSYPAAPGTVFFTRPGEVRCWSVQRLEGACVFFTGDFLSEAFVDSRMMDLFSCFAQERPAPLLVLGRRERNKFLARFADMTEEIAQRPSDAPEALRAILYQLLILLNRWFTARYGGGTGASSRQPVEAFRRMLEQEYHRRHGVSSYARQLGVSPGYLSYCCRRVLGESAGRLIQRRIALEARRLLCYGDRPVGEIGRRLGFRDPAYFARFVRRMTGSGPRALRSGADRFRVA